MTLYHRHDIPKLVTAIKQGKPSPIYLLIGERYLSLQAADQLLQALLPDPTVRSQSTKLIDGEQEDPIHTLNLLKTYSLFGGRQVFRVSDSQLFHSKEVAKTIWSQACKAFEKNELRQAVSYLRQLTAIAQVEESELAGLTDGEWQASFAFAKPDTGWLASAFAAAKGEEGTGHQNSPGRKDPAEHYIAAIEAGLPEDNILLLLAETVDKRKKLYKVLQNSGAVVDLTVAEGSSKAARTEQDSLLLDLIRQTLTEFGKTMEPKAVQALLERVGFHPVAVVRETEKLALYVGENRHITMADLTAMVGRTREDALFELTESFVDQDLSRTLIIARRLHEGGTHPLVMVAGIRNQLRKLMLVVSLRQSGPPDYVNGISFAAFQKGYLVALKAAKEDCLRQLPSHPFALHMMFSKSERYSIDQLAKMLTNLLQAEFKLKSSGLPPLLVLEHFFWQSLIKRMPNSP